MYLSEQTLPDLQFVKKRYHLLAKQFHPDKNKQTNSQDTILHLNNAYQTISEHLYEEIREQVNLFQSVFNTVLARAQRLKHQRQVFLGVSLPFLALTL